MAQRPVASSRDKVRDFRARMRARGMKLVQFWVPDVTSPAFQAEARLIAASPHEAQDQCFATRFPSSDPL